METLAGFIKVFVTLTQIGYCPSPPDAGFVEYDFVNEQCVIHLEERLDYRKPLLYTPPIEMKN